MSTAEPERRPWYRRLLDWRLAAFLGLTVAVALGFAAVQARQNATDARAKAAKATANANAERLQRIQADRTLRLELGQRADLQLCRVTKRIVTASRVSAQILRILLAQSVAQSKGQQLSAQQRRFVQLLRTDVRRLDLVLGSAHHLAPLSPVDCKHVPHLNTGNGASAPVRPLPRSLASVRAVQTRIGGARCSAAPGGGAICHWPNKPWAVGITRNLVYVWRNTHVQYAHTNR